MPLVSLGKVTVTTAGIPVRLTSNLAAPADPRRTQSLMVSQITGNTGKLYIGTTSALNKTTLAGVVAVIPAPAGNLPGFSAQIEIAPGGIQVSELWLDADTSGEGALVVCGDA